jgi:iron(III) transport system substrate-binding protein
LTVDLARLWRANTDGLFMPVNSRILNQRIPASLRDPKGNWFAFSQRARVIMYRKGKINPSQLSTYEDLASAKWKGRVITRSSSNVYNQSLVAWMIATQGAQATERWTKGLVANFARPPQGNDTAQIEAIAAGVADLALVNTYYLARLGADKDPAKQAIFNQVGVFFPNQKTTGTHMNISGAGVIRTAPNKAGAIKFLEYLASPSAQNYFAQGNFEFPVVQGVKIDPILARFGKFKSSTANLATVGSQLPQAIQIMNRSDWK